MEDKLKSIGASISHGATTVSLMMPVRGIKIYYNVGYIIEAGRLVIMLGLDSMDNTRILVDGTPVLEGILDEVIIEEDTLYIRFIHRDY